MLRNIIKWNCHEVLDSISWKIAKRSNLNLYGWRLEEGGRTKCFKIGYNQS